MEQNKIFHFNCGGEEFAIAEQTLSLHPDDFLYKMLCNKDMKPGQLIKAKNGEMIYFIDRDPTIMKAILNYYRDNVFEKPKDTSEELWKQNLDFFGINKPDESSNTRNMLDQIKQLTANLETTNEKIQKLKSIVEPQVQKPEVKLTEPKKPIIKNLYPMDSGLDLRNFTNVKLFAHNKYKNFGFGFITGSDELELTYDVHCANIKFFNCYWNYFTREFKLFPECVNWVFANHKYDDHNWFFADKDRIVHLGIHHVDRRIWLQICIMKPGKDSFTTDCADVESFSELE